MLSDIPQSMASGEVTEEDVRRAARIARLALDDAELPRFIADLRDIRAASAALDGLDSPDGLDALDGLDSPDELDSRLHPEVSSGSACPLREDVPSATFPPEALRTLAPVMRGEHVSMPALSWSRSARLKTGEHGADAGSVE